MGCPPANLSGFRERLHLRVILRYSYAGAGNYFAIIIELKSPTANSNLFQAHPSTLVFISYQRVVTVLRYTVLLLRYEPLKFIYRIHITLIVLCFKRQRTVFGHEVIGYLCA